MDDEDDLVNIADLYRENKELKDKINNLEEIISTVKEDFLNSNNEVLSLQDKLDKVIRLVRGHSYSIISKNNKTTKLELADDSLDELMHLLED